MTKHYMDRYLSNQAFYKIQSQSMIDNPDQRMVDDVNSFTKTALSLSLTIFDAVIDLISFSNILFSIYPPLFVVLFVYSIGGTVISIFLGKVTLPLFNQKVFPMLYAIGTRFNGNVVSVFSEFGFFKLHAREKGS